MPTLLGIMLVLLTLGIIVPIFRWLRRIRPTTNSVVAFSSSQRIQGLASDLKLRVKKVRDDFSDLERRCLHDFQETEAHQMYDKFVRPGSCATPLQPRAIRNRRRRRISSLCAGYKIDALDASRMSGAFMSFCERLLAMNRIWEQEKQIKKLQSDVLSAETSRQTDSFHAFCHKLLLHNNVWQVERQAGKMGLEVIMLKGNLAVAMKRAAREVMEDPKHKRLIQSYVKKMTVKVGSCKLALGTLNALHERELKEFTWEWQQDCWNLGREVETFNLARQASLIDQDLQNEFEDSLCESLRAARRRIEDLKALLDTYQHTLVDVPTCDEDEETFTISSLTCVSSDYRGVNTPTRKGLACLSRMPTTPRNIRSARWVDHSKRQRLAWPKRLIFGNHTGFSFNPLFYGPNVSPQALTSPQRSYGRRNGVIGTAIREARRQAGHAHVRSSVAQWRI